MSSIRTSSAILYGAALVFVALILLVRYAIAPTIVNNFGLPGTLATLAVLYLIGVAIERRG